MYLMPTPLAARRRPRSLRLGLNTAPQPTPRICPAWGCGPRPIVPRTPSWRTPAPAGASAGTPVPAGFPANQLFINTDGSQWIYSSSQSKWINAGTPTNVSAAQSPAATPTTPATATGATQIDGQGNTWTYNGSTWQLTTAASSSSLPAGTVSSVAPTAAAPADASGYSTILDWFTQSTLISGVPNWAMALGAGLLVAHIMKPAAPQGRY